MKIGSSTYSFKRFTGTTPEEADRTVLSIIEEAPKYGLTGLELLAVQLESTDKKYLGEIKRRAVLNGLDLYALSVHNNFVHPDAEARREEVRKVREWIRVGAHLGAGIIRLFGGRWNTVDFNQLMKQEGLEDPLPGYKYEDAVDWNIECFSELVDEALDLGVILTVENHWGITYSAQGVLDIVRAIDSPAFQVIMDCGNFRVNTYEQLSELAPHTVLVHVKSYQGGGIYYDLDIDYTKIIRMLKEHGYRGYLSLEFEGRMAPSVAIPAQVQLMEALVRHV